jgi:accessory colonization factor AcfC
MKKLSALTALRTRLSRVPLVAASLLLLVGMSSAHGQTLRIYGPGGPAPAMKELAAAFGKANGLEVEVTAGPTSKWIKQAKNDAHLIYSGSENMMLEFMKAFDNKIVADTVEPMYLRPSTILVRKGNPKNIKGLRDLAKPGMKVLVTEGAGQVGMWEDAAGRTGELTLLKNFRANIAQFAANSGLAKKTWLATPEIDAWLIWNHWQIANPDIADQVPVEPELTIWRSTDIALTQSGQKLPVAAEFVEFMRSAEGEAVFKRWGWSR